MSKQFVICYDEISTENCVQYVAGNFNDVLKNFTFDKTDIANLKFEIEDLSSVLFIITAILCFAILLVFILILVLAWRINRENAESIVRSSQQIFLNRAYEPDDEIYNLFSTQNVYDYDVKLPLESRTDNGRLGAK
ncbi:uncharacterized protein LOC110828720 [Zootermopsis nevadensis]|uniref:uncharacterized protein LOC110828720 n=1 Tax=Zootermopsis nevadensis TaxID=136037 RepID=UPI000B8EBC86|nr:uncharacterized protein LOC110828720 [Zootermopsis nevadensis]